MAVRRFRGSRVVQSTEVEKEVRTLSPTWVRQAIRRQANRSTSRQSGATGMHWTILTEALKLADYGLMKKACTGPSVCCENANANTDYRWEIKSLHRTVYRL